MDDEPLVVKAYPVEPRFDNVVQVERLPRDEIKRRYGPPLCMSRGPRIGDACPYCKLPKGHEGKHRPAPDDGWHEVTW